MAPRLGKTMERAWGENIDKGKRLQSGSGRFRSPSRQTRGNLPALVMEHSTDLGSPTCIEHTVISIQLNSLRRFYILLDRWGRYVFVSVLDSTLRAGVAGDVSVCQNV